MSYQISKKAAIGLGIFVFIIVAAGIPLTFILTKNYYANEIIGDQVLKWDLDTVKAEGSFNTGENIIFTLNSTFPTGGYTILPPTVIFSSSITDRVLWINFYAIEPTGMVTLAEEKYSTQEIVVFPISGNWTVYCNNLQIEIEIEYCNC